MQSLNQQIVKNVIKFGILGIVIIIFLFSPLGFFSTIGAGHVGVLTRFGAVNRVANPGVVVKIPIIEIVTEMETRTQKEQVEAQAASKDLQIVKSTIALNYHLRGEKAVEVYQNIGVEYNERIIAPAMQEAFKATTARFTASDLISKREAVKTQAYTELKKRLEKYNVIVDDFNIVNFDFSGEFNQAIENKTVAQQNKERAQIEAETALVEAQGQADAQRKVEESGNLSPAYLEFLAIQKWNGVLPNATSGTPFINIPTR
ncbi:MAG TPA: prohibitin family protein [Candidatus Limnocylindrales bacterium]|nr:prohibitin family protein [Candidatus Limnocylindrales bacterium]